MARLLTDDEVERQLGDLPGWRREGDALVATLEAPDFPTAIRLVDEVAVEAEEMDHHPDIDIRYTKITCSLSTHSAGGITEKDLAMAGAIEAVKGKG